MRWTIPIFVSALAAALFGAAALSPALSLVGCVNERESRTSPPRTVDEQEPDAQAQNEDERPFVPKIGQHGLIVRCGGGKATPENPLSVQLDLLRSPERFFDRHVQRALRLHEITGNARIVFHMLNGWDVEGMWHSAAVLDAIPARRRAAFENAVQRLTAAGITVGTYSSSKVPDVIDSVRIADVGKGELFDYDNPCHRETMMAIFEPLLDLGVREIWLDNTSSAAVRQEWAKFAEDLRAKGGYFVMEATPLIDRKLDLSVVRQVASASWTRRIYLHNDLMDDHWLPLPDDTELIAVISAHQTHDKSVPSGRIERSRYLAEQVTKRLQQGFSVFNMQEEIDAEFFELIRAWTGQRQSQEDSSTNGSLSHVGD